VITPLVIARLQQADCQQRGFVLDGFPRTVGQVPCMLFCLARLLTAVSRVARAGGGSREERTAADARGRADSAAGALAEATHSQLFSMLRASELLFVCAESAVRHANRRRVQHCRRATNRCPLSTIRDC